MERPNPDRLDLSRLKFWAEPDHTVSPTDGYKVGATPASSHKLARCDELSIKVITDSSLNKASTC